MSKWSDFYRSRAGMPKYTEYFKQRYAPFLDALFTTIQLSDTVVELGCGTALVSKLVEEHFGKYVEVIGLDIDADILHMAESKLGRHTVRLAASDIRYCVYGDVVHSHGVLEHFSDSDIRRVIAETERSRVRAAVHYVPGVKYGTPSFGDERLLTLADWVMIANPHAALEFNEGHDYLLTWRYSL